MQLVCYTPWCSTDSDVVVEQTRGGIWGELRWESWGRKGGQLGIVKRWERVRDWMGRLGGGGDSGL